MKIRAGRVILATGAHERPLVFGNNDLPGVMLASAVSAYIHRYGVLPGRDAVLFTNNDRAYQAAIDLADCGARVVVVDARAPVDGILPDAARRLGVTVMAGAVVMAAHGKRRVASVDVHAYARPVRRARRDLAMRSAGDVGRLEPGAAPARAIRRQAAVAGAQGLLRARQERAGRSQRGAAAGEFDLCLALAQATRAGAEAASAAGFSVSTALPFPGRRPPPRTR